MKEKKILKKLLYDDDDISNAESRVGLFAVQLFL